MSDSGGGIVAITGALLAAGCPPEYLDETRTQLGFQEIPNLSSLVYKQLTEAIEVVRSRHEGEAL